MANCKAAEAMTKPLAQLTIDGRIGVLTLDAPPVNALSTPLRAGMLRATEAAMADPAIDAMVLICAGRTFMVGGDITELSIPIPDRPPSLFEVQKAIEDAPKPVVAAIHGTALGGGLEVALVCHHRVAVPSAFLGLPEVTLGLLSGAGGTQRLPRAVGVEAALDLATSGRRASATECLDLGLIDALMSEGRLREGAIDYARRIVAARKPLRRLRDEAVRIRSGRDAATVFEAFRAENAARFRGFRAPEAIIKAIEAAIALPYDAGIEEELRLFAELAAGDQPAALQYHFFAERQARKIPGLIAEDRAPDIATAAIIGEDSANITAMLADAGLPTIAAKAGEGAPAVDLIVVADSAHVGSLGTVAPNAIIANMAGNADPERIAMFASRAASTIGLRLLPSAQPSRMVEIVRTTHTSDTTITAVLSLARRAGKAAVLVRSCPGSASDRMLIQHQAGVHALLAEGVSPERIDRVLLDFGFDVPPCASGAVMGGSAAMPEDGTIPERPDHAPPDLSDEDVVAYALHPIINEGARLLGAGKIIRPSDIDVLWVAGHGWPRYRGGPAYHADHIGLDRVLATIRALQKRHGIIWQPAPLLERLVAEGRRFRDLSSL